MKKRADLLLVEKKIVSSRSKAQAMIMAGQIYADGKKINKSGEILNKEKPLTLKLLKRDLNWKLLVYPELFLGEEYFKGNIEIGKIADFTLVDRDISLLSVDDILKCKIVATIVNGEMVYKDF